MFQVERVNSLLTANNNKHLFQTIHNYMLMHVAEADQPDDVKPPEMTQFWKT